MRDTIDAAVAAIQPLLSEKCEIGLILGSGLGDYGDGLKNARYVSYADIEGFPVSSVQGHAGRFVIGERMGRQVIVMQGRFHYYEGYPQGAIALGVRTLKRLGVKKLLLTNAAGGVDTSFTPGDLMVITDHINYSGNNPLIGKNDDRFGPRFPDQSNVYDKALRQRLQAAAARAGIPLCEGVYMMFSGPTFETPAEIRMARILGASAVGMSTVPEAIVATHCGIRVIGISMITNMAAGILDQPLTHTEVYDTAKRTGAQFTKLVDLILTDVF